MSSESLIVKTPMHSPPHPGRINERGRISPEMALRLAKAFGSTLEMWMRLQCAYDLGEALRRSAKAVVDIRRLDRAKEFA